MQDPEIGQAAGAVWQYLEWHGETSTLKLRASLKMSQSSLFLALGWLAREGKVRLLSDENGRRVALRRD
ncbi:MAG: winged helix-turn-helix domain-containing protein [Elusimicrobiota bacterium]